MLCSSEHNSTFSHAGPMLKNQAIFTDQLKFQLFRYDHWFSGKVVSTPLDYVL